MSKSILVIDTPENCAKCPCFLEVATDCCGVNGKDIDGHGKPDWCPLRNLPEKCEIDTNLSEIEYFRRIGFNACIDEISKGANRNEERTV